MAQPSIITTQLELIIPNQRESIEKKERRAKINKIIGLTITYILLVIGAIIVLFPFYYMIIASCMVEDDLSAGLLFPQTGNLIENMVQNYSDTLERFNYGRYVGNTLIVGVATTALQMLITIFSAFAFARLKFRGRDILFTLFLGTMMIPGEMMVISNYVTMSNLGLISGSGQTMIQAYLVMILPFISSVFYIYLLRQNFKQIPNELYLAAKIDGKSDWEYLWKVMIPLASPTLITIAILSLIGSWNAYVWPKLTVGNSDYWLISVALRGTEALTKEIHEVKYTQYTWQMSATVLTVVPLLVLFIIFRKYIMRGTGRAGIKG